MSGAELLEQRIKEHQLLEESFRWYLDLHKYGSVPRMFYRIYPQGPLFPGGQSTRLGRVMIGRVGFGRATAWGARAAFAWVRSA